MNSSNDIEWGARFLPGVDLTLWLWLVLTVLVAAVVGGIALVIS